MPQMNPIWWTTLFMIFILTLLVTNCINYFFSNKFNSNKGFKNSSIKNLNWKW